MWAGGSEWWLVFVVKESPFLVGPQSRSESWWTSLQTSYLSFTEAFRNTAGSLIGSSLRVLMGLWHVPMISRTKSQWGFILDRKLSYLKCTLTHVFSTVKPNLFPYLSTGEARVYDKRLSVLQKNRRLVMLGESYNSIYVTVYI